MAWIDQNNIKVCISKYYKEHVKKCASLHYERRGWPTKSYIDTSDLTVN